MTRSRRAVSIVELLVVMSASTVVLSLTSVLIVRTMHSQMQSRAHGDVERNALRLSEQFRRDVHQARTAMPGQAGVQDGAFLQLQLMNEQEVEYRIESSGASDMVLRLGTRGGKPGAREEFTFPAACEVAIRELQSPPRLALTIITPPITTDTSHGKPPAGTVATPVSLQVEAVIGRDRRIAAASGAGEGAP